MNIKQMYLDRTSHNLKYKYGSQVKLTEITYHQTSNSATALNERNYLNNRKDNVYVSFHFVVDETQAIQCLPLNVHGWHSGDGANGTGNKYSIGVEIARSTHSDINIRNQAIANGAKLIAQLMKENGIPMSKVKSHHDRNGKHCPHDILDRYGEQKFRNLIQAELNKLNGVAKPQPKPQQPTSNGTWLSGTNFQVRIKETLNIRKSASFDAPIVGQVHKYDVYTIVSVENGLGKLKSGVGYISMNTKYVEKVEVKHTVTFKEYRVRITCDTLNVRKEPTTSSKVVTTVKKGQVYTIVGETNGWLKLKSGAGYISSAYTTRV